MDRCSTAARILVVEDDRKAADIIALYLRHAGHTVFVEHAGDGARRRLEHENFDLLILDIMLPGASGLELCREVRAASGTPVVFLTARTAEDQRIEGLELGADDYVCKPFSPRELVARVAAVLRRAPRTADTVLRCGPLSLEPSTHSVTIHGQDVLLTRSEFAILHALMERPGRVRRRDELLRRITDGNDPPLDRTIDVHIKNLRRKLEAQGSPTRFVETVIGVGYRIAVPRPAGSE